MLPRRAVTAIAAVVDVALHGRVEPVAAKVLAARLALASRHLEPLLQSLVRNGILRSVRGPQGGYELARERRLISAGAIVRAVVRDDQTATRSSLPLVDTVVGPAVAEAATGMMTALDELTIDALCRRAAEAHSAAGSRVGEFHI